MGEFAIPCKSLQSYAKFIQVNTTKTSDSSIPYLVESSEMNRILRLLYKLFDIRITFFDMEGHELDYFEVKEISPFCAFSRKEKDFDSKCLACDRLHLKEAKEKRNILFYRCHSGLWEGIIPLYKEERYLGALIFGQIQLEGVESPPPDLTGEGKRLYKKLPVFSKDYILDLAEFLKVVSEYIIDRELVKYRNRTWVEIIKTYASANLHRKITLRDLVRETGKSSSLVSHAFQEETGLSPLQFVKKLKIEKARELLRNGDSVRTVAAALGFWDEFHFSKLFKKETGRAPGEFRKTPES